MTSSELFKKLEKLETEQINPATASIDQVSIEECLTMINREDQLVPLAVAKEIANISKAVEKIVQAFRTGGRLFYFGAGTSGRLGILDASECPPTFGTMPEMVQGCIAGGPEAVFRAIEGAEDDPQNGIDDFNNLGISPKDIICGIAASGRTPYILGAFEAAKKINCTTILITTVSQETAIANGAIADIMICPIVGPEVIAGSTRMKSGTAQKLVLNMLTTASMIQIGKTYNNVMIDLQPTNKKLKERSKRILMNTTGIDYQATQAILEQSDWQLKTAIVATKGQISPDQARLLIRKANGKVKLAIEMLAISCFSS